MHKILLTLLLISSLSAGQGTCLENEEVIFSFERSNGNVLAICAACSNEYIVYRYGPSGTPDMQYPVNLEPSSWSYFGEGCMQPISGEYSGYRYNFVQFTNNGYKYQVFDISDSDGDRIEVGVVVILPDGSSSVMFGEVNSVIGNRADARAFHLMDELPGASLLDEILLEVGHNSLVDSHTRSDLPYFGEYDNGRGFILTIDEDSITLQSIYEDEPRGIAAYRDVTRVTDGAHFIIEIDEDTCSSVLMTCYVYVVLTGDGSVMKTTCYDSYQDAFMGNNPGSWVNWTKH